nr:hypothetical protein GCM10020092_050560 [Actinoplanes digitatis]
MQQVEQVGGFFDGVGALGDDDSVHTIADLAVNMVGELYEVVKCERGAGQPTEVVHVDLDACLREPRYCPEQLAGGEGRGYSPTGLRRHRDRAAERVQGHPVAVR